MVSKTKKKKVNKRGGERTRVKTKQRKTAQLDKFASPISPFEHYPIKSDYDDTKEPQIWNRIPLLMDTKIYIDGLKIIRKEKAKEIFTDTSKKPIRAVALILAKDKPGYHERMTDAELYELIKPETKRPENIQYTYEFPICNIIKDIIPAYKVPSTINEGKIDINGTIHFLDDSQFQEYNNTLCKTFIILGFISKYLWEDKAFNYFILIKGGKAVQLLLNKMGDYNPYDSHDIDISIVPKDGFEYNQDSIRIMALHIGYLLKWFMPNIDIKEKLPDSEYSTVVKLYCCDFKFAFCDIDYGKQSSTLFNSKRIEHFSFDKLNLYYISSNLDMTLEEKCYYFIESFKNITNSDEAIKKIAIFRMNKNKKAIVRLATKDTVRKYLEKYNKDDTDQFIECLYEKLNC